MPKADPVAKSVNLRVRDDMRMLIDRAAKIRGMTRSAFMIDAAYRAAEDTLLDPTFIKVDAESYRHDLDILDGPPGGDGFARLMRVGKAGPSTLLAQWAQEPSFAPEDDFPEIDDMTVRPEDIFRGRSCRTPA